MMPAKYPEGSARYIRFVEKNEKNVETAKKDLA
jgi:hypothetical protein